MLLHVTFKSLWSICNFKNLVSWFPATFVICTSEPSAKNVGHACSGGNWSPHIPTVQVRLTLDAGRTFLKASYVHDNTERLVSPWYLANMTIPLHQECWMLMFYNVCLHTEEKPLVECVFKLVFTMCWQHSANWEGWWWWWWREHHFIMGIAIFFSPSLYSQFNPLLFQSFLK